MHRLITVILQNRCSCKLFTVVRLFCTPVRNLDHFSFEKTIRALVNSAFFKHLGIKQESAGEKNSAFLPVTKLEANGQFATLSANR